MDHLGFIRDADPRGVRLMSPHGGAESGAGHHMQVTAKSTDDFSAVAGGARVAAMTDMSEILKWADRIRCMQIERAEAARTVVCSVSDAPVLEAAVVLLGADDLITICGSQACPGGVAYVIDANALAAGLEADLRRWRP